MKLPTWDELRRDSGQLDILEHPLNESLFVAGPPGSGKTVLALRRASMLVDCDTMVTIITFNRMLRRLSELLSDGKVSTKTMHRFVWRDYRDRAKADPPGSDSGYNWDWQEMLNTLAKSNPLPKIDHLIVDEGQDLAAGFFEYASLHAAAVLTVFADDDQAFGDRRTTLEQIRAAGNLPNPRLLQQNHRNAPEIARVAEHFHAGRLPAAHVQRSPIGTLPRLIRTQGPKATAIMIATWFRNRGGSVGVIVDSNALGAEIQGLLMVDLPDARIDRYDHSLQNENSINVNAAGITILNRESVKGQEFDSAFVLELDRLLPWRTDSMRRRMYMICSRARDYLILVYGPRSLTDDANSQLPASNILERS